MFLVFVDTKLAPTQTSMQKLKIFMFQKLGCVDPQIYTRSLQNAMSKVKVQTWQRGQGALSKSRPATTCRSGFVVSDENRTGNSLPVGNGRKLLTFCFLLLSAILQTAVPSPATILSQDKKLGQECEGLGS